MVIKMVDQYGNQTEEEVYAQGGYVCSCCGSLNCDREFDDSKVRKSSNERSKK